MNNRLIGNSELKVSEISFGCMSLNVTSTESSTLVRQAVDAGINFFDTADLYDQGENEKLVGQALKPIRDQVIIATKVGNQWREDGSGWDWNPSKDYILKAVEDSLLRLKTDYIDLYQLHGGTIDDPIEEIIEAFEILKQQGKIREYGISSIRPNVIKAWTEKSNMGSVIMQYSLLDRRPEEEMLELLHQNNISVLSRGTLAKGLLVNKPVKAYLGYTKSQVEDIQKVVKETGDSLSRSIQFVLYHPAVASAVLGIRTDKQLESVLQSDLHAVTKSDLKRILEILKPMKYEIHR